MVSVKKRVAAEHAMRHRGLDQYSDQPWFLAPAYLSGVGPEERCFFQDFIDFYSPKWKAQLTQMLKYSTLLQSLADTGQPNPF